MNRKTAWETAAEAEGTTESERALTRLARKAFLSLWSYPNVYADEGRSKGKGDGKELVDLLIVFGNDVLLFSDKHCAFQTDTDVQVAWPRWYKRAIEKSARQLAGAESFLRRFPQRIFVDKACQTALPVALPDPSLARYFLIAVTRGCHQAAARFFGSGSSGSVMLNSTLEGDAHYGAPFRIGFPLKGRRFVHVLDEMTVDILLEELDTVPDLVNYLACKEQYLSSLFLKGSKVKQFTLVILALVSLTLAACGTSSGTASVATSPTALPTASAKNTADQAQLLIELEKKAWDLYHNKRIDEVRKYYIPEFRAVSADGVSSLEDSLKAANEITTKDFSMSDIKVTFPVQDTALLTYKYTSTATYKGKTSTDTMISSTVWVMKDGEWKTALYSEAKAGH